MQHHPDIYRQPDEIDLFELVENLVREKVLIIGFTVVAGIVATIAAFVLPPTYSSEATINRAPSSNFSKVNAVNSLITHYRWEGEDSSSTVDSEQVYSDFQTKLTSFDTIEHAFRQSKNAQEIIASAENTDIALQTALNAFQNNYSVSTGGRNDTSGRVTVRINSNEPEEAERLINQVILPYAQNQISAQLEMDKRILIAQEKNYIKQQIIDTEFSFLANLRLRVMELEEALEQAKTANIVDPITTEFNEAVLNQGLYLLGEKLLTAQIQTVKDRIEQYRYFSNPQENDESKPFIRGVAEKIVPLRRLEQTNLDFSDLEPVTVERKAERAFFPDKPKKKLIIVLGILLGGMLGVGAAMVRMMIRSRKEKMLALQTQ